MTKGDITQNYCGNILCVLCVSQTTRALCKKKYLSCTTSLRCTCVIVFTGDDSSIKRLAPDRTMFIQRCHP